MDTIAPTAERVRHALYGIDGPEVSRSADRRAHRVRDIFADMHRRGHITAEDRDVGETFVAIMVKAYPERYARVSYGERFAEGTPASQLASGIVDGIGRAVDHHAAHQASLAAIPTESCRAAIMLAAHGTSLTEIGRLLGGYRDEPRASATGRTRVQIALEALGDHYARVRKQRR